MQPIQELLHRIKWDADYGQGEFTLGYYDRVEHEEKIVPFRAISMDPQQPATLSFADDDGVVRHIPLHRVRTVCKNGMAIWRRPEPPPAAH